MSSVQLSLRDWELIRDSLEFYMKVRGVQHISEEVNKVRPVVLKAIEDKL